MFILHVSLNYVYSLTDQIILPVSIMATFSQIYMHSLQAIEMTSLNTENFLIKPFVSGLMVASP